MFDFSPIQILLVLGIALIVFGPKRLPEMGKSLGRGLREFRSSVTGDPPAAAVAQISSDEPVAAHTP
jgi:sec-independent protein translocase protein TatA